jgi:hypothetical protein
LSKIPIAAELHELAGELNKQSLKVLMPDVGARTAETDVIEVLKAIIQLLHSNLKVLAPEANHLVLSDFVITKDNIRMIASCEYGRLLGRNKARRNQLENRPLIEGVEKVTLPLPQGVSVTPMRGDNKIFIVINL